MADTIDSRESSADDEGTPTTTHAEWGAGHPRLVFVVGDAAWDGSPAREHLLADEVTDIGSAESAHLRLDGLAGLHAQITHRPDDEYVLQVFGEAGLSAAVDQSGAPRTEQILRTGARVELGDWAMFFSRDESADHGRPFGGRLGGEGAHQQPQDDRPDYSETDGPSHD